MRTIRDEAATDQAAMAPSERAARRPRRVGAALLALSIGLFGSVAGAAAAQAAEPPALGSDGQNVVLKDDIMSHERTGPQGLLEPGANGDFYGSLWSGSNNTSQEAVFRYFEHPRGEAGPPPVRIETNVGSLTGKVYSLSTDADGNFYTLHRDPAGGADPRGYQVTRWSPDGSAHVSKPVTVPGHPAAEIVGIAVTGTGDDVTVTYRVDERGNTAANGVWRGAWGDAPAPMHATPIPSSPNPYQSPYLEVGTLADGTEVVYFQIAPTELGILIDGQITSPDTNFGFTDTAEGPTGQPDLSEITWDEGGQPRLGQMIQGIDARQAGQGALYVSTGWSLFRLDPLMTQAPEEILDFAEIDFFTFYQSRFGTDGRLYLSGFGPWGVMPVDILTLAAPSLSYPGGLSANLCAIAPGDAVTVTPDAVAGTPAPSWFVSDGDLPAGVTLDRDTGALTLEPGGELDATEVTITAKNGVTGGTPSATITAQVSKTPLPFAQTTEPVITGEPEPGETLTASVAAWIPAAELALQWFRDGKAIAGETGAAYTVTEADQGTELSVRAKGTAECRTPAQTDSEAFLVPDAEDPGTPPTQQPDPKPTQPATPPTEKGPVTPATPGTPNLVETGGDAVVWISAGALAVAAVLAGAIILLGRFRKR